MKSIKNLTTTKKSKFYTKLCKVYGMVLKAKKEFNEISDLFKDYEGIEEEKQVCETILMELGLFTDEEYLRHLHKLHEIREEKIEENNRRIEEIREYINRKTSNSEIF